MLNVEKAAENEITYKTSSHYLGRPVLKAFTPL